MLRKAKQTLFLKRKCIVTKLKTGCFSDFLQMRHSHWTAMLQNLAYDDPIEFVAVL